MFSIQIDNTIKSSINYKMRYRRVSLLLERIQDLPRPIKLLDVGGSVAYWENLLFCRPDIQRDDYTITVCNLDPERLRQGLTRELDSEYNILRSDARYLSEFKDSEFDVVHSNSVIEHVGGISDQLNMANAVRRVGKFHYVQTPNYFFPYEPHFKAIGFQWLPESLKIRLIQSRKMGHRPRAHNHEEAVRIAHSVMLLSYREFSELFSFSEIIREKYLGLTKSFIAIGSE